MKDEEVLQILRESGALLKGHFELRSGLHSDSYFQCANVLRYPRRAEKLCSALAAKIKAAETGADCVISPAVGGIIVGHEIARALGLPAIFAEKENGKLAMRRFRIEAASKFIVAEDVVTRGGRVQETIDIVKNSGGRAAAAVFLVDRSGGKVDFGCPAYSLLEMQSVTYEPENCPLCSKGIPLKHPGS
ncbi:MAG: orotate phosphoribosyltransferase [Kiritimatiellia bacterium]